MTEANKAALEEFMDDARSCNECGGYDFNLSKETFDTIVKALQAPSIPDGWKLVPIEPTEDMMFEGYDHVNVSWEEQSYKMMGNAYKAMLAAAPQPANTTGENE